MKNYPRGDYHNLLPTYYNNGNSREERKVAIIRKSDIAIATKTKPRLIDLVACRTVGEYKRKREKIRKFYLDEQKSREKEAAQQKLDAQQETRSKSTEDERDNEQPGPSNPNGTITQKQTASKATTESPKKKSKPTKRSNNRKPSLFEAKSKQAALAQSKLEKRKRRHQQPRRKMSLINKDLESFSISDTVEVINIVTGCPHQSRITIVISNSPKVFMSQSGPRMKSMDKKFQRLQSTNKERNKALTTIEPNWAEQCTAPVINLALNAEPILDETRNEKTRLEGYHLFR